MDYFIRDGHGLGLQSYFDWRRYIQTLKVIKVNNTGIEGDKSRVMRLCSRDKEANELYQLFHIRNQLYRKAYQHKTSVAIQHMLKEALKFTGENLCLRKLGINGEIGDFSILEAWRNMDAFQLLNDSIEDIIESADQLPESPQKKNCWAFCSKPSEPDENNGIKKAKEIFRRIRTRDTLKLISYERRKRGPQKINAFNQQFKTMYQQEFEETISGKIVEKRDEFHYGMKDTNPIQECYFYKKNDKKNAHHLSREEVSDMLPTTFFEAQHWYFYEKAAGKLCLMWKT